MAKRLLSEKEVLKQLNIPDFRHMTKDSLIAFVSKTSEMSPEVAMKALSQFPDFAKNLSEIIKEYQKIADKTIKSSDDSVKQIYENDKIILKSLAILLEKGDNLTTEERLFILKEMETISEREAYKDSEHKKFLVQMFTIAGTVVVAVTGVAAAVLTGGKFDINLPKK